MAATIEDVHKEVQEVKTAVNEAKDKTLEVVNNADLFKNINNPIPADITLPDGTVVKNIAKINQTIDTQIKQSLSEVQDSIEQIDNKLSDYATNTSLTEVQNDIKNLQLNSNNIEVMYSNVKLDKLVNLPDGIYIINIAGHAFSFEISSRCTFVYLNAPRATDDNTEDSTFVFTYKRTGQNSGGFTAHKHVIKWESGSVSTMSDSLTSYTCYSLIKIANL
jgi:hypothetical protein